MDLVFQVTNICDGVYLHSYGRSQNPLFFRHSSEHIAEMIMTKTQESLIYKPFIEILVLTAYSLLYFVYASSEDSVQKSIHMA